jgi:sterol desaturase/sphingolipid hydroxylase (fatty acid hydroxylase superfamily)
VRPAYLPIAVAGILAAFFVVERFVPLRRTRAPLLLRLFINFAVSGLAFLTSMLVVRPSALGALAWTSRASFGLVHLVPVSAWAQSVIGFVSLDLSFYYWHVLNHRVPFLWRFHNVHHIDPDLDVSTGFRFHFGEVLMSTVFRVTQVSVIGMSFATFAAYELAFQANTLFHHSNVRLPIHVERLLNAVLVTPRMHGIHHSQVRDETNSNFGVVFRWWDALHRTMRLNVAQSRIEIGVAGYSQPEDNQLWYALTLPFRRQRDYWRREDGTVPDRDAGALVQNRTRLAE